MRAQANDQALVEVKELGASIRSAVAKLYRRFRIERGDGDLGDVASEVLAVLCKTGPQTLKGLSDFQRVTPASMSQVVNRLTSAGYARRDADPEDGRRVIFSATDAGRELFLADRALRHAWFDAQLVGLSEPDRAAVLRVATILSEIAES